MNPLERSLDHQVWNQGRVFRKKSYENVYKKYSYLDQARELRKAQKTGESN